MPLYQIEHICHLTDMQQDKLAAEITKIHAKKFAAPSLFVNVTFTNASSQRTYVAGRRNSVNRILAHVRHGPSRTQDDYNALCASIQDAWNEIIVWENEGAHDTVLKTIFVLGNIVAGREWGMPLPAAGQDKEWLKKNLGIFLMRGQDYGEEEFLQLIDELKTREEFRAILE